MRRHDGGQVDGGDPQLGPWSPSIEPCQLLIQTDQGSESLAPAFRQQLEDHKISCSMSSKGCCWNNAVVENFFSTLKHQLDLDVDAETPNSPEPLIMQLAF